MAGKRVSIDMIACIIIIILCNVLSLQMSMSVTLNPMKQDVKKGKMRFVSNCFPYHGYIWNYGALPQVRVAALCVCVCVCEAKLPAHRRGRIPPTSTPNTQAKGDNDPLDVCEIGQRVWARGDVRQVKVLGTVALIDEGILLPTPSTSSLSTLTDCVQERLTGRSWPLT